MMPGLDVSSMLMLALAGGLAGAVGWFFRQVPRAVLTWAERMATSTLEVKEPDLVVLLDRVIFERSGQRRQQIDRMTPSGARAPANGWHFFRHDGHLLAAMRDQEDGGGKGGDLSDLVKRPRVALYCLGGFGPLDNLLAAAKDLERADRREEARSFYFVPRHWGGWERHAAHQVGGMEHVILPSDMSDQIIATGKRFFDSGDWYRRVGANWAQGWLFEGAPGTGKSRAAWGIAQHFGAKLYVLDIGRPGLDNGELCRLIRQVDGRSVILFDDVDKTLEMLRSQGQKEGASQVTLAGILAALELPGAAGRLVIFTANNVDLLDPDGTGALTRPGRIDKRWNFQVADYGQVVRMLDRFGTDIDEGDREGWIRDRVGRSTAAIYSELLERSNVI